MVNVFSYAVAYNSQLKLNTETRTQFLCIKFQDDRGLDASYMEATGNQNVDLNSQFGTITHPHLQLSQNSIPSPPQSLNFVVHPCPSFTRFCESRISSKYHYFQKPDFTEKLTSHSTYSFKTKTIYGVVAQLCQTALKRESGIIRALLSTLRFTLDFQPFD